MARSKETPNTAAPETDDVQQSLELLDRVLLEFDDPNSGPSSRIHDPSDDVAAKVEASVAEPPPPEEAARLISALMPRGSPRSSPGQSLRRSPPDPGGCLTSPSQATAATQTTLPKASRHHGSKKLSSRFGSLPFDLSSHAAPQSPPAWLQVLENRAQRDCAAGSSSSSSACPVGDRNLLHLPIQNPLTTSLSQEPNSESSVSDVEGEEQFSDDSLEGQVSSSDREADLRDLGSTTSHECTGETETEEVEGEGEGRQRGSIAWDIPLDWDLDLAACEASASKKRRKDKPPGGVSRSQPQTPSCPPPPLPTSISGGGTYVIRERKKRPALEEAFHYCPVIPTSATYTCGLSHVSQYKPQHKNKAKITKGKSLPTLHTYKQPSRLCVPETKKSSKTNLDDNSEILNHVEQTIEVNNKHDIKMSPQNSSIETITQVELQCNKIKSKEDESIDTSPSQINHNNLENAINNSKNNVQEMSFKIMRPKKIRPHSMPPSEGDIVVFKSTVQLESSNVEKHKKIRPISMPFNEGNNVLIQNTNACISEPCNASSITNDNVQSHDVCTNGLDVCNTDVTDTSANIQDLSDASSNVPCEPDPDYSDSEDAPRVPQLNKLRPQSVCITKSSPVQIKRRPTSCSHLITSNENMAQSDSLPAANGMEVCNIMQVQQVEEKIDVLLSQHTKENKSEENFTPLIEKAAEIQSSEAINTAIVNGEMDNQIQDIIEENVKDSANNIEEVNKNKVDVEDIKVLAVPAQIIEVFEQEDGNPGVALLENIEQSYERDTELEAILAQHIEISSKNIMLAQNSQTQNDIFISQSTEKDNTEDKTEVVLTLSTDVPSVNTNSFEKCVLDNQTLPYNLQDNVPACLEKENPLVPNCTQSKSDDSGLPPPPTEDELEFRSEMDDKLGTVSSLVQTDISVLGKKHKLCLDSPSEEQVVPSMSFRTNVLLTPDEPPHSLVVLGNIDLDDKVTVNCLNNMMEPGKKLIECSMDDDESITITTVIIESKDDENKKDEDNFIPIKRPADLFASKLESKLSRDSQRRKSHGSTLEMTSRVQENRRSAPECSFLFPQGYNTIPLSFAVTNKPPNRTKEVQERPPVPLPQTPVVETPLPPPPGPLEPTYKSIRKEKKTNGIAKRHQQPPPLPPHQNLSPPEDEYAEPRNIPDFSSTARKHSKPVRPRNLHKDEKAPPLPPHQTEIFEAEKPLPPTPLTPVQNVKLSILDDFDSHPLPPSPGSPKPPRPLPTSATFPVPPSPASMHKASPHGGRRRLTPPSPILPRPSSPRSRTHPLPPSPCDELDAGGSRPRRPLPSPPESDYGFAAREAGATGLGSLKTRSVDAGLGRGLREQLQTSISQSREVGSDRRTLPTELSGATPRRHVAQQYNTGLRSGKKKGRAPTVPPHASLPETPVFTRGCDIPRGPYRPPAVGIPVLRSSLSEEGDRLVLCGPARGWYPKQRQNKSARSTENLDQASSVWGEPRKPQTLPPNLNPPKFFHRSPREALRRVTSLLIRRAGNTSKEPRTSKDVVSPNGASGSQCETPQRQKRSFFRNFWKKSKHYSLEQ